MVAETVVGSELLDDWSSAWQECKDKGEKWGGRGKGGDIIEGLGLGLLGYEIRVTGKCYRFY